MEQQKYKDKGKQKGTIFADSYPVCVCLCMWVFETIIRALTQLANCFQLQRLHIVHLWDGKTQEGEKSVVDTCWTQSFGYDPFVVYIDSFDRTRTNKNM